MKQVFLFQNCPRRKNRNGLSILFTAAEHAQRWMDMPSFYPTTPTRMGSHSAWQSWKLLLVVASSVRLVIAPPCFGEIQSHEP